MLLGALHFHLARFMRIRCCIFGGLILDVRYAIAKHRFTQRNTMLSKTENTAIRPQFAICAGEMEVQDSVSDVNCAFCFFLSFFFVLPYRQSNTPTSYNIHPHITHTHL